MKRVKLADLPIQWMRGNGYRKADIVNDGEYRCVLYGELFTKHKSPLIQLSDLSRTNKRGKVQTIAGDVLIPGTSTAKKSDMVLGREVNIDGVFLGGDIIVLRLQQGLFAPKFLPYFLESQEAFEQLEPYIQGATGIIHLSNTGIKRLKVLLPPISEQQRLVSILDEAFAAIDQAKANTERNLKNAKELFDSYLQEVFENNEWMPTTLKELTTKIGSGATPRGGQKSYKSEGISLVRSMNVHDWEFKNHNLAFINDKQARDLDGVTLQEDDVLINITGASIARCCIFPKTYLPARVNQHVSIIRPKKELLDPKFLNLLLTSKPYKNQLLLTGEQGATRQAITKAQIESFRISIPPIPTQQSIVRKLDDLRAETQKLEAVYQKKLSDLDELKKSILQKAFTGELTSA